MESFIQHAEYLESIKKGNNDVYAKTPTSSFQYVPMTHTYKPNTSSHNVFKLELPISKLRNSVVVNDEDDSDDSDDVDDNDDSDSNIHDNYNNNISSNNNINNTNNGIIKNKYR